MVRTHYKIGPVCEQCGQDIRDGNVSVHVNSDQPSTGVRELLFTCDSCAAVLPETALSKRWNPLLEVDLRDADSVRYAQRLVSDDLVSYTEDQSDKSLHWHRAAVGKFELLMDRAMGVTTDVEEHRGTWEMPQIQLEKNAEA